jgi:hypothetical protein
MADISPRSAEQSPLHARRHHGIAAGQQLRRRLFRQWFHARDGQVALVEEVGFPGPAGRDQGDRQTGKTAGHHAEHERACAVKPR